MVFVERGLSLLNDKGRLGFILPHKFFQAEYGQPLRELIARNQYLAKIINFGDQQVFAKVTTYTCLLFLNKAGNNTFRYVKVHDLGAWRNNESIVEGELQTEKVTDKEWNFLIGPGVSLFERLNIMPIKLGNIANLFVGLQTDGDEIFILEEVEKVGNRVRCRSKATGKVHEFEDDHLKKLLKGSINIRRYSLSDVTKRLIFPYETHNGKSVLISASEYANKYPLTWEYLNINKKKLAGRNRIHVISPEWHGYFHKQNHTLFEIPKLVVPSIANGSCFAADPNGEYYFVGSGGGGGGGYGITLTQGINLSVQYLLGLLNSRLLEAYLRNISTPFRGGYMALNRQYIEQLPLRTIDFANPAEVRQHDEMVRLVEQMLALHQKVAASSNPADKTLYQRQIAATDRQIDRLVYGLYNLSEEEIRIVEGQT